LDPLAGFWGPLWPVYNSKADSGERYAGSFTDDGYNP
jgi:hypothetical protein